MQKNPKLASYINGKWVLPSGRRTHPVVNPSTEQVIANLPLAGQNEIDSACFAADQAWQIYRHSPIELRIDYCLKIIKLCQKYSDALAEAMISEIATPRKLAYSSQVKDGIQHFQAAIQAAQEFCFEVRRGRNLWLYEPIGVSALIMPWNWPIKQLSARLAPALLAGCTMVVKPSEYAPLSADIFAQIIDEAGLPAGIFNMIHGDATTGAGLAKHRLIRHIGFTGSTKAGISIGENAAHTVKRVTQELGGKSANIILRNSNWKKFVAEGVKHCFRNNGQSCNAPSRLLVQQDIYEEAIELAKLTADSLTIGDPNDGEYDLGALASLKQYQKAQTYISIGTKEARLITGGSLRPKNVKKHGFYIRPTIFADVRPDSRLAQEEIFAPILCIMPFTHLDHALKIANGTIYGLAAYIASHDPQATGYLVRRLEAGSIYINGSKQDYASPFGGYKQSGNGRERGIHGLQEFLEVKTINGIPALPEEMQHS